MRFRLTLLYRLSHAQNAISGVACSLRLQAFAFEEENTMRVVLSRAGRLVAIMVIALVAGFAALHAAPAAAQTVHHAQVAAKSVTPGWNNPCRRHCGCYSQCRCTYGYGGCGN